MTSISRRAPILSIFTKLVPYYPPFVAFAEKNFPFSHIQEYRPLSANT